MAKRRRSRFGKISGFLYMGVAAVLIYFFATNAIRVYEQHKQYSRLVEEKEQLVQEKESLEKEVELLNDKDYVIRWARENYIFSKDGEEVIKLPETEE